MLDTIDSALELLRKAYALAVEARESKDPSASLKAKNLMRRAKRLLEEEET